MSEAADFENRLTAAEAGVEHAAADAAAARHLAAAGDRDLADLTIKVDANRTAINALGVQTAERFNHLDAKVDANRTAINALGVQTAERFAHLEAKMDAGFRHVDANLRQVDANFDEVRAKLNESAVGLALIVELLSPGADEN
jgi:hypothetical protein